MQVEREIPPSYCPSYLNPQDRLLMVATPFGVINTSEKTRIITLEAVYDNSDIRTDYFDRNCMLQDWYVQDFVGRNLTEQYLRKAIKTLPKWLQDQDWSYRKGEKYSMSDHPYGQLECHPTGLTIVNSQSMTMHVRFILTMGWLELFEMNQKRDGDLKWNPLPQITDITELIREKTRKTITDEVVVIPEQPIGPDTPLPVIPEEKKEKSNPHMSLLPFC